MSPTTTRRVSLLITIVTATLGPAARLATGQTEGSIRGTVVSRADQHPIPDARVSVAGANRAAVTNQNGEYVISDVPVGTYRVQVRMIGFGERTDTVTVTAGEVATADFSLEPRPLALDAVAVTALGIERTQRETPYAMSQVNAAELTKASPLTVQSGLYGEVPGLKIQQNASGPTGGTNITIRGIKSILGNNRPLVVVDGIPIRDDSSGYSDVGWVYDRDLGTGINDINPNDIASVNVLKGASASALYGSQAANGVILITTKQGVKNTGLGMDFSSSSLFDNVAYVPDYQNEYGGGINGLILRFRPNNGEFMIDTVTGTPYAAYGGGIGAAHSWGPPMRGQMVMWWDGTMRPFTPQPDNYRDLYQNGRTLENSVSFSNATDRSRYRLAYTRNEWTGTFPGAQQSRNTVSLTGDLHLSDRLRANLTFNYYDKALTNPPPKVYVAFSFPRSLKTDLLRQDYKTASGYMTTSRDYPRLHTTEEQLMREVLWEGLQNRYEVGQDRLVGSLRLNYAFADWLTLRLQGGTDYADNTIEYDQRTSQPASLGPSGGYQVRRRQDRVLYGDVLLSAQRTLTPALGLSLQVGAATTRNRTGETAAWTNGGLVAENWFSVNNSSSTPGQYAGRAADRTDGVFGSATLSYRDFLYLTATGRNDWTSTLPPESNSYFYPSVGASFIFSDAFRLPSQISSGKVRVNYAEVGRGAPRYLANNVYSFTSWDGGVLLNSFSTTVPPLALKPERKQETEIGLEMGFLDERWHVDGSFYHQRNVDQIIPLAIAASSGATNVVVNAGLMTNTGQELQLSGFPIRTGDFQWSTTVNFSRNRNEVRRLAAGLETIVLQNFEDNLYIEARPNHPFGEIYGYDVRRAPGGQKIVNQNGFYAKSDTLSLVGNIMPNWLGGLNNTFQYKGLSLSLLFDVRMGGNYASMSDYYALATGRAKETLFGRDQAHGGLPYYIDPAGNYVQLPSHDAVAPGGAMVFHDGIILPGANEVLDASGNVVGYAPNDHLVPEWEYYETNFDWKNQGIYPRVVYKNNYIKLRELALSFDLPAAWARHVPARNLRLSIIGRNLFYLYKTVPNIDPESATSTVDYRQGLNDYGAYHPTTRSIGFKITGSF
jgi:iron complex outermembrane receptor protein